MKRTQPWCVQFVSTRGEGTYRHCKYHYEQRYALVTVCVFGLSKLCFGELALTATNASARSKNLFDDGRLAE